MAATAETSTVATDSDIAARWCVCLHEAGHAAAGCHVFKQTTKAAVFSNASGVTYTGSGTGVPTSFKDALVAAAGQAAAEDFVAEYQQEIVEATKALFARGIMTLPARR